MSQILDYSKEGFIIPLERGNIKTYASVNVEMYYDDGQLEPTGKYFIYLLHPALGSCYFNIEQEVGTASWVSKGAPPGLENDMIQEVGTAINFSRQQRSLSSKHKD
ncbi:MAG: hypothetical protein Q7T76_07080 [Ferruginibacter sp.]|nr:hypothetical protein [Ferruginibacter sp.]